MCVSVFLNYFQERDVFFANIQEKSLLIKMPTEGLYIKWRSFNFLFKGRLCNGILNCTMFSSSTLLSNSEWYSPSLLLMSTTAYQKHFYRKNSVEDLGWFSAKRSVIIVIVRIEILRIHFYSNTLSHCFYNLITYINIKTYN